MKGKLKKYFTKLHENKWVKDQTVVKSSYADV